MKVVLSAVLGLALMNGVALANTDCSDASNFGEVTKAELTQMVEKKSAFIVDVNSADSYKKNHVPGAIHFAANEKNFSKMLPADKGTMIVAYCGGPACTAWERAATAACKEGYTNIRHFKGGISGWTKKSS
ncbi:MAG: rhodanese-like domain-containing protein [Bacteriovoracia bacterium]